MQIPGQSNLITKETEIPDSLLLLCGPAGAGKSMYCKQFFVDCLMNGDYCIYISSSLTDRQYRSLFADVDESKLLQGSHFLNPYLQKTLAGHSASSSLSTSVSENKLSLTLEIIHDLIKKVKMVRMMTTTKKNKIRLMNIHWIILKRYVLFLIP
jgi:archaellum biogenesis ATPase FlaH